MHPEAQRAFNAGLRIDRALPSPQLSKRWIAGEVYLVVRVREGGSYHAALMLSGGRLRASERFPLAGMAFSR
jgi:hypothetical protein